MPSVINCPSCERRLSVPDTLVGAAVKCPTCGETFTADPNRPPPRRHDDEPGTIPLREEPDDTPEPRRRSRYRDERDEDDRDEFRRPRRRRNRKPGQVTAVGVMMLIGGIMAILLALALGAGSAGMCCLWPGTYYSLVMGILAIVKGSELLGERAHHMQPPRSVAVMMIINIVAADVTNLALGIVCLCLLNDPEVEGYFRS